jgi:hypothetical protein
MTATAQAFAGPPEIDDRKQDGSQLDVDALLRQAMGSPGLMGASGSVEQPVDAITPFPSPLLAPRQRILPTALRWDSASLGMYPNHNPHLRK